MTKVYKLIHGQNVKTYLDPYNLFKRTFSLHNLSVEHKELQNTCRTFAEEKLKPIAGELDRNERFPKEEIKQLGQLGLLAINVHADYGGSGLDTLAISVAIEEISRGCGSTGSIVSIHNCLYACLLNRLGSEKQKDHFLKLCSDGNLGAFALSETDAGSDVAAMSTTATNDGEYWIINGTKAWVTSAYEAKAAIVFATVDKNLQHKGITAFIVPMDTEGVCVMRKEKKLGIRATSTCSIRLEDVRVPNWCLIGQPGAGFRMAMEQLDLARIGIASQALGIAQASLDAAINYASIRKAFGSYLIDMPTVKGHIADIALRLESARLLTWKAAALKDEGKRSTKYSSMAKIAASQCASFAAHTAMQIMGGMGYVNDMPAERHYRDARITEIYGGVTDIQKLVIADQVIREYGI
uniref:Short-chain specific acyl-CoA dehydrogenase, mitochondrial n=1 Tax=Xenopsylla cheopis TaxID=163159 RepID=A0A6M2DRI3_XENCH